MNIIFLLHHYISIYIIFLFIFIILLFLYKKNKIDFLCKKISILLVYSLHIQICLGLILLIKRYFLIIKNGLSLFDILYINDLRFKLIEHPLIMIITVITTTIVNFKLKNYNKISYKIILIYIFILFTLLSRIPIKIFF